MGMRQVLLVGAYRHRPIQSIKHADGVIGSRTRIKVVKNKLAAPFRQAEFDIMYDGTGISAAGNLIDHGIRFGLVEKSGSWFSLNRRSARSGARQLAQR